MKRNQQFDQRVVHIKYGAGDLLKEEKDTADVLFDDYKIGQKTVKLSELRFV